MVETILKVVRVFIGSPGGLDIERQAAARIVEQINRSHAEHWGCQINLVGWEATLPGYSRAQSLINQDLDKCDYFVGVLWDRWGSPPDDSGGQYSSGFEEEFERARERVETGLMKDIALFFKEVAEAQLKDPGDSLKPVLAFRERCTKARKPLFKQFKEAEDFGPIFRAKIEEIGWREYNVLKALQTEVLDPKQPAMDDKAIPDTTGSSHRLVGTSSASFLTEMLTRPADWDATNSHEIARLRLIAFGASRAGNDEMYLGNHDANLLFSVRHQYDFDDAEIRGLIDTGIVAFHHQNVPLWYWMAAPHKSKNAFERTNILAALGNDQERPNAIRLLQCTGQTTPRLDDVFNEKRALTSWLKGDASDNTFNAALEFLKTNGDSQDLATMETFVADVPAKRRSALTEAIISMWAKRDLPKAFQKLIEYNPDTMNEMGVRLLFEKPEAVTTAIARECVKLKSETVRRRATLLLHTRLAIDAGTAEALLADPDLEVRLVAVEALVRHGTALQEDTIKSALTNSQPRGLLGIAYGMAGRSDDSYYQRYQQNRLSQLSEEELRRRVDGRTVFDELEVITLYEKYTQKCSTEIRANLADRFKGHFDRKLALTAALLQHDASRLAEIQKLEDYVRKVLTSRTLDIFCAYTNGADLNLVRATVDNCDIASSKNILRFMGRHGDWTDVPRILTLYQRRYSNAVNALLIPSDEWTRPTSQALYAIGKSRLADLLQLEIDNSVRRALIVQFSQKDVAKLSGYLINLLNDADDQFRKVLALKCALSLTQTRIRKLLDKYTKQDGQRYYNSIHWLDLGASMTRDTVKSVAKFELLKFA